MQGTKAKEKKKEKDDKGRWRMRKKKIGGDSERGGVRESDHMCEKERVRER